MRTTDSFLTRLDDHTSLLNRILPKPTKQISFKARAPELAILLSLILMVWLFAAVTAKSADNPLAGGAKNQAATALTVTQSPAVTTESPKPSEYNLMTDDDNQPPDASSSSSHVTSRLTVNGQNLPIPANGTVHKTITDDNGQTSVTMSSQTSGGDSSNSSSSLNLNVTTNSSSSSLNQSSSEGGATDR